MKNVIDLKTKKAKQNQLPVGMANVAYINKQAAKWHKALDGAYNGQLMQVKAGGNLSGVSQYPGPFGHKTQGVVMTKQAYEAYLKLCSAAEYESHTAYEIDPAVAAMAYDEVLTVEDVTELYQAISETHRGI